MVEQFLEWYGLVCSVMQIFLLKESILSRYSNACSFPVPTKTNTVLSVLPFV